MHMLCKVRSENGYGFLRPGLKTGVENGIFWSEIGSGFGDAGGTPPPKIPRSTPHPPGLYRTIVKRVQSTLSKTDTVGTGSNRPSQRGVCLIGSLVTVK